MEVPRVRVWLRIPDPFFCAKGSDFPKLKLEVG